MKVNLCFPKSNTMKYREINQIEFNQKEPNYEDLASYIDHNTKCLIYLEDSGELVIIDSQLKLKKALKEYHQYGQKTLNILVENLKNFESYTNNKIVWSKSEEDPFITLDNPELIIEILKYPKESKETLKRYKSYSIQWEIKNIGDFPLKNINCRCPDEHVKILNFTMSNLNEGEKGTALLLFQYVDSSPSKWKKTEIKLELYNQVGQCIVKSERFLKFEAEFSPDYSHEELKSMLQMNEKSIFKALEACEGDPNMAVEWLLEQESRQT